jgi:hypothetical protein
MPETVSRLIRAGANVATLTVGAAIGAAAVAFWGAQQPTTILAKSTMDPSYSIEEPFVIPVIVWVVGIGAGLFFAAAVLKYLRRI